jgi:methylthioribose-1-phosphate isomerase
MRAQGKEMMPIWWDEDTGAVTIIDQRKLPHELRMVELKNEQDAVRAIRDMYVRGAPLIGVTAAYGVYLGLRRLAEADGIASGLEEIGSYIRSARPTAVNLSWAVDKVMAAVAGIQDPTSVVTAALQSARQIAQLEIVNCRLIGDHGRPLIEAISREKGGQTVNILTHCNAGWLACVAYGTATAPIYAAFDSGIDVHVWVDETRPLNQGARLTAWELGQHGVPHTVITDNAGGHLMQHGLVDVVIVGTDRTTHTGDVANKIGTYLKALAAKDNAVPFYVALPSSTFDWELTDGIRQIPIEERDPDEVRFIYGLDDGIAREVLVPPESSPAANYAFDVTPARLVTGFITERGLCAANADSIRELFPDKMKEKRHGRGTVPDA